MNLDILKGNWKQLRGNMKSEFGKLTDDEIMQAEGEASKLAGLIQEKYGLTKDEAENRINAFLRKHS